jgi:predicted ATPase
VWRVLGVGGTENRFEARRATTTSLVGDEEIELLLRRWEQAERGEGCIVLISCELGTGKSRIAQSFSERANDEPHTRLRYFCSPRHQGRALYRSIAQLEQAAGFRHDDTDEQWPKMHKPIFGQWADSTRRRGVDTAERSAIDATP